MIDQDGVVLEPELEMSEPIAALLEALAKAQAAMENAKKESNNPHFNRRYADLASVLDAVRATLASNGLSIIQAPSYHQGTVTVLTMLGHSSGQWMRNRLRMTLVKQDAQGIGSAITYARRYALMAIAGVAPEDDDGNAAVERASERPASAPRAPAPPNGAPVPAEAVEQARAFRAALQDAGMAGDLTQIREVWSAASNAGLPSGILKTLSKDYTEAMRVAQQPAEARQ